MTQEQELLYKLARLLRNTDNLTPAQWGARSLHYLAELRKLHPQKYDVLVKLCPRYVSRAESLPTVCKERLVSDGV